MTKKRKKESTRQVRLLFDSTGKASGVVFESSLSTVKLTTFAMLA